MSSSNKLQKREKLQQVNRNIFSLMLSDSDHQEEYKQVMIGKKCQFQHEKSKQNLNNNPQVLQSEQNNQKNNVILQQQSCNKLDNNKNTLTNEFKGFSKLKRRSNSSRRIKSSRVNNEKSSLQKSKYRNNMSIAKIKNIFQDAEEMDSQKFVVYHDEEVKSKNSEKETNKIYQKSKEFLTTKSTLTQSPVIRISNASQYSTKKSFESFYRSEKLPLNRTQQSQYSMKKVLDIKLTQNAPIKISKKMIQRKKVPLNLAKMQNFHQFVHKKISKSEVLMTTLSKNTSGLRVLWPQFYMDQQNTGQNILNAKLKAACTTSNYYISLSSTQIDVRNQDYTGKVRSNFLGSHFNVFSEGVNPQKIDNKNQNVRKLLATIVYYSQNSQMNFKTMKVYMIKEAYNYYDLEGTTLKEEQTNLQDLYNLGKNKEKIRLLKNRKPTYIKLQNKFKLNFGGRISKPSPKNFILQDRKGKEVMMLGKLAQEKYLMHISYPLTPHIAMGIALAELDNKLIFD